MSLKENLGPNVAVGRTKREVKPRNELALEDMFRIQRTKKIATIRSLNRL